MNNYIGLNIKYLCEKNILTQKDFGGLFGLTHAVVNAYIKGKSNPQVETIQKICNHFEISIDEFINTDLATQPRNTNNATKEVAAEPHTPYTNDKDALIAALRETIETQKELIEALRSRNNNAKPQAS